MMTFNPQQHMTNLKGKDYLEVKWRLVWFRDDHPNGAISTEVLSFDPLLVKASIHTEEGALLATGHASATAKAGAVWSGRDFEKAETAAIGRALGHAGYGTQFEPDDEGDYLSDSPVERMPQNTAQKPANNAPAQPKHSTPAKAQKQASTGELDALLKDGGWTMFYPMAYAMYDNPNHAKNSVSKMVKDNVILPTDTIQQALDKVSAHIENSRAAVMENEGRSDTIPGGEKIFDGDF